MQASLDEKYKAIEDKDQEVRTTKKLLREKDREIESFKANISANEGVIMVSSSIDHKHICIYICD